MVIVGEHYYREAKSRNKGVIQSGVTNLVKADVRWCNLGSGRASCLSPSSRADGIAATTLLLPFTLRGGR